MKPSTINSQFSAHADRGPHFAQTEIAQDYVSQVAFPSSFSFSIYKAKPAVVL